MAISTVSNSRSIPSSLFEATKNVTSKMSKNLKGNTLYIAKKVHENAVPLVAMAAVYSLPGVEAGAAAYALCMTICCGTFAPMIPVFAPACAVGCAPTLLLPV